MPRRISPLKLEIVSRGLVQSDVAEEAGLSETRLSRILNGRVEPRDYELKNLARAIGIPKESIPGRLDTLPALPATDNRAHVLSPSGASPKTAD